MYSIIYIHANMFHFHSFTNLLFILNSTKYIYDEATMSYVETITMTSNARSPTTREKLRRQISSSHKNLR